MKKVVGSQFVFAYPKEFTTLPEYTAHAGKLVRVLRVLSHQDTRNGPSEYDYEGERMYEVQCEDDGWIGHAWRHELNEAHHDL